MVRAGFDTGLPRSPRWAMRTEFGEGTSELTEAVARAKQRGRNLLDLTVSNPTMCGFHYDEVALLDPLAGIEGLRYDADPMGMRAARESVSTLYYAPRGVRVSADRLFLTTSTSEAYGYLLRLLCDPGDQILVPQPSYPLFDLLARMQDVELVSYPLLLHDQWRVNFAELEGTIGPRTRAIVVVHPNNPTGHFTHAEDREALIAIALRHGLVLIVDEVFLDYSLESRSGSKSFAANTLPILTFVLSGVSKVLALPQMKLAWTAICGPEEQCREALKRLEYIADTFLSLQAPVQHALSSWLPLAAPMQAQIRNRLQDNLRALDLRLQESTLARRARVEAGWSVLLRIPAMEDDEVLALHLLELAGVITHPGSFYGLPRRGWIVVSLLPEPAVFAIAVDLLVSTVETLANRESDGATTVE